jgi:hypothetical protein
MRRRRIASFEEVMIQRESNVMVFLKKRMSLCEKI